LEEQDPAAVREGGGGGGRHAVISDLAFRLASSGLENVYELDVPL